MARGRLICKFIAKFARYDTAATPMNLLWNAPAVVDDGTQAGVSARLEKPLEFRVQLSSFDELERLRKRISGNDPLSQLRLVAHKRELENRGLVRSDGTPDIIVQDRLVEIVTVRTDLVELRVPEPPGLFVHEVTPRGWGLSLSNPRQNLWFIILRGKDRSVR